jgi:aldehyde oxidoreductase
MIKKVLNVNGVERTLIVDQEALLSDVLRKQLHLTGTKVGCGAGQCGACNVILDGKLVRSCVVKMKKVENWAAITTIEGIGTPLNLHPIQKAFIFHHALQCGFCTPGFIVSAKALLDQNLNPTREDVRDWFQKYRNACRCTGYSMIVDAVLDAAKCLRGEITDQALEYKAPANGDVYGTRIPRPTFVAKVCGLWDFGEDMATQLPAGTLHCALVQPKVSHAIIKGIDTSAAELMPGVFKVVTHKDVKGRNRITGLITFPTNKGDGWDRPILNDTKINQYGDVVAIVCADTKENATAAAEKVKVDLEILPAYMNAPAAAAEDAIEIHPGTPNVYFECYNNKGPDAKPIIAKAAHKVSGEYYLQRQPHMPLEPDCGFAYIDDQKRVVVHSKTIAAHLHLYMIAPGLGLEPDQLVLVQNPTGATFGYKFSPTLEALAAAATMACGGRPVYLGYDWYQQQTYTGKRSPFWLRGTLACDEEGKMLALDSSWECDHGPYSEFGDLVTLRGTQFIGAGYDLKSVRGIGKTVCTNHGWGSAFRAYGSPQSFMLSESLVDELARKAGFDPFEFRYKNIYRPGATTPTGQVPEVFCFEEMFSLARPKYQDAVARAKLKSTDTVKCGVGVSLGIYGCGLDGPDTSGAWAELLPNGDVMIGNCWQDHGQGSDAATVAFAHQALRELNLKPSQIKLCLNDTSLTPNSGPSGGSRQNVVTGNAIVAACRLLLDAMKKDGGFRTHAEMVAAKVPTKYEGSWTTPSTHQDADGQGAPFCIYMYALFISEVSVDISTGKTTVDRMIYVGDNGTITNRGTVDGQVYGGLVQGVGLALTEDFEKLDKHTSLIGSGFPFIKDVPDDMELIYVVNPREHGAFGQAGVGEGPLTSPHVSILNAIDDACGVRIRAIPAYPEKILKALKSDKKSYDPSDAVKDGYISQGGIDTLKKK